MELDHNLKGSTVLVTGGTGFTGRSLLRQLLTKQCKIRCIARPSSNIPDDLREPIDWFLGNVYDPDVIKKAMEGVNYVFHVAACFRDSGADDDEYRKVHVVSTQWLAKEALNQPDFKRFVHTSTMGVHGHIKNPPANELSPYSPGDIYQDTKLEAELWIREFAPKNKLPFTVVRPAAILGPGDKRLLKLFKFAKLGFFPLLDGHKTLYHMIHVEDLASCLIYAATSPTALEQVFICGNEDYTDVVEILNQIGNTLGKKVRFISLPSKPLFFITDLVENFSLKMNVTPILYRRRLAFFTKDRAFSTKKMKDTIGFKPRYSNQEGIADTFDGYRASGWILNHCNSHLTIFSVCIL